MVLQRKSSDGQFKEWRSKDSQEDTAAEPSFAQSLPPPIMTMPLPMMPPYVPASPRSSRSQKRSLEDAVDPAPVKRIKTTAPPLPVPSSSQPFPTPSSTQIPSTSKATALKGKAPSNPKEKRGAVFKGKCPQNILERADRVRTQRFFMIDRQREDGQLEEKFSVLGSTGNVYTVRIGRKPTCDCPDARKGNHCKHILFIYLKVLQVDSSSSHWYQKGLLTSELQEIFDNAPEAPNSVQAPRLRAAMDRALGKTPQESQPGSSSQGNKRMPGPDDDCPICYDSMGSEDEKTLVFCESCGNALHIECLTKWKETAQSKGQAVTCVYCRANWPMPSGASSASGSGSQSLEGYLNLGAVAGLSPERDESSYYSGPRRGYRRGRHRYY